MVSRPYRHENGCEEVMKKMILRILTLSYTGLIISCNSLPARNPQLQREWMLVAYSSYSKQELISGGAKIDLTAPVLNGEIRGGAFMGCNKMFFRSEFKKNGTLKISGLGSTLMACPDMKLEDDFAKGFKNMTRYEINGHFLILHDKQGSTMKFIASDWD